MKILQNLRLFGIKSAKASDAHFLDLSGLQIFLSNIKSRYSTKSKVLEQTITSGSWTDAGTGLIQNTITVNGVSSSSKVEVMLSSSSTVEQKQAWMSAMIVSGKSGTNSITLEGLGDKPTVNIPMTILIRGD